MKDFMCTIMKQPDEIVADSTFGRLIAKWPKAAFHDKINRLFAGIDEQAINPIIVSDLLPDFVQEYDEETHEPIGPNYIDSLVAVLAPILYSEDRTQPIHVLKSVLSQLYRHPVYQAFIEENNPQEEQPNNINKEP